MKIYFQAIFKSCFSERNRSIQYCISVPCVASVWLLWSGTVSSSAPEWHGWVAELGPSCSSVVVPLAAVVVPLAAVVVPLAAVVVPLAAAVSLGLLWSDSWCVWRSSDIFSREVACFVVEPRSSAVVYRSQIMIFIIICLQYLIL